MSLLASNKPLTWYHFRAFYNTSAKSAHKILKRFVRSNFLSPMLKFNGNILWSNLKVQRWLTQFPNESRLLKYSTLLWFCTILLVYLTEPHSSSISLCIAYFEFPLHLRSLFLRFSWFYFFQFSFSVDESRFFTLGNKGQNAQPQNKQSLFVNSVFSWAQQLKFWRLLWSPDHQLNCMVWC